MFPARAFPARYFAPRYWPKVGSATAPPLLYVPGPISVGEVAAGPVTVRELPRAETVSIAEVGGIVVSVREL